MGWDPKISQSLIDRYSNGPSASRASQVKGLHEDIRSALDIWSDHTIETFLQGSYRNSTAIADINDVDIVAMYRPWSRPRSPSEWQWLFDRIAYCLRNSSYVNGSVELGDKCVKLDGDLKADVVPAVASSAYSTLDPVTVYSRRDYEERPNHPRTHYDNGVRKQAATGDAYKATVRLFKRWKQQYPQLKAPSFYVECAVHSVPSADFNAYLPLSFTSVGVALCAYTRTKYIASVAGDKDILVPSEWHPDDFEKFQQKLLRDVQLVLDAMKASTASTADGLWKAAFGG